MDANETGLVVSLFKTIIDNPEKAALGLVILVGGWRTVLEIMHYNKREESKEDYVDALIKENKELREELRRIRNSRNGDLSNR